MKSFPLQIVTPEGVCFDGEAELLNVCTSAGFVTVLAGHADYFAALDIGKATLVSGGTRREAACGGGFLSVEQGSARMVATTFEYAETIDAARAARAEAKARARLAEQTDERELRMARAKLARALLRQELSEKK